MPHWVEWLYLDPSAGWIRMAGVLAVCGIAVTIGYALKALDDDKTED